MGTKGVTLEMVTPYAKRLAHIQMMDRQVGTSSSHTGKPYVEPKPVTKFIDRPCIIPGQVGHSMHECSTVRERVQHVAPRGRGGRNTGMMRPAMNAHNDHEPARDIAGEVAELRDMMRSMHTSIRTMQSEVRSQPSPSPQ
jgi:hypothetical protein